MSRDRIGQLVIACVVIALIIWVARNTYWAEVKVPMPATGEAATNPFFAIQRFSQELGARPQWKRGLQLPGSAGVVYLSAWNWDLTADRRQRIEHWVESGGRLIVDRSLITTSDAFEHWSGLEAHDKAQPRSNTRGPKTNVRLTRFVGNRCYTLEEMPPGSGDSRSYTICGMRPAANILVHGRPVKWALQRGDAGMQVARVELGHGSVTFMNGTPFEGRGLFDDDNASMFVAATQLHRGDEIYFFSETEHASILALAWEYGWPAISLGIVLLALTLWRGGARFGPPVAATENARRSLAEQIRGTGAFTLRLGGGASLQRAAARALNEVASRYITAYERLSGTERMQTLAQNTGFEATDLAAALNYSGLRRSEHLRDVLELLESARRRILLKNTRPRHGNRI